MAKRCELTGTGVQSGNNVSHSNRKTRRRFLPNLHEVSVISTALGQAFKLRITSATLRSIDHNGGLDAFLLTAKSNNLTDLANKLRRKIKKTVAVDVKKAPAAKKVVVKKVSARASKKTETSKKKTAAA